MASLVHCKVCKSSFFGNNIRQSQSGLARHMLEHHSGEGAPTGKGRPKGSGRFTEKLGGVYLTEAQMGRLLAQPGDTVAEKVRGVLDRIAS